MNAIQILIVGAFSALSCFAQEVAMEIPRMKINFNVLSNLGDERLVKKYSKFCIKDQTEVNRVESLKDRKLIGFLGDRDKLLKNCFFFNRSQVDVFINLRIKDINLEAFDARLLSVMGNPNSAELAGEKNLLIKTWYIWNGETDATKIELINIVLGAKKEGTKEKIQFAIISEGKP